MFICKALQLVYIVGLSSQQQLPANDNTFKIYAKAKLLPRDKTYASGLSLNYNNNFVLRSCQTGSSVLMVSQLRYGSTKIEISLPKDTA
jgi:hypothetical protein